MGAWAESRRQKAESRKQKAESRRQKAEGRRQKAESRKQKAECGRQKGKGRRLAWHCDCLLPTAYCLLISRGRMLSGLHHP